MKKSVPMRSIWHSLAWKEWHEHKWKLAAITVILLGTGAMSFLGVERPWPRDILVGIGVAFVLCIVPLAVFVGLGEAAGERSRATLPFLQSLPVPMWPVALNKLAFGFLTILAPLLFALGIVFAGYSLLASSDGVATAKATAAEPFTWGIDNWLVDSALMLSAISASFFIWAAAAGVNRKDEVSAGAVALTAMFGWGVLLAAAWWCLDSWVFNFDWTHSPESWTDAQMLLPVAGLSTAPGGFVGVSVMQMEVGSKIAWILPVGLSIAAIAHFGLATWFVRRFGRVSDFNVRSPRTASVGTGALDWLGRPRRSPLSAIAWKQFRESGPIALVGLAIVVGTVLAYFIPAVFQPAGNQLRPRVGEIYAAVAMAIGYCMAMVIGIGVMLYDLGPRLNEFWRSRPIKSDLWFWTKFVSGMAILAAAIYGPILLIAMLGDESAVAHANHPEVPVIAAMHFAVFAAAVAMTCLVRHAVYAAILSIAFVYSSCLIVGFVFLVKEILRGAQWRYSDLFELAESQFATSLLLSFVTSTILAWLAVRYDWGPKSVR